MTITDFAARAALTTRTARRTGESYEIEMTRDYDYPIEDVWSAWTSPERLPRWLGEPRGELRVGSHVDLTIDLDVVHLVIQKCEAPASLTVTWQGDDEPESEVHLHLKPLGAGRTRLVLTHSRLNLDGALGVGPGWEEFLYVLEIFLDGGSASTVPWDRHGVVTALTEEWQKVIG